MAAPRRNDDARSSVLVAVRLTPDERDAIRNAAEREDVTVSEYLRGKALPPARSRPKRSA